MQFIKCFHFFRNETSTIPRLDKRLVGQDPTTLFNLFGLIPWDPPGFMIIGIWPILMGVSMWVQQKLNPAPADPIQAKILPFFLFLTIILASFPSGLVVYWTINNILTCTTVCDCEKNYGKNKLNVKKISLDEIKKFWPEKAPDIQIVQKYLKKYEKENCY